MSISIMKGKAALAVTISVITLLIANAAVADEDDAIAARAKQALVEARLPDTAGIVVTSFNGEVDLDGVVRSEHMRQEAARLVGGLPGVTAVGNDLEVRRRSDAPDSDDVISHQVRKALIAAGISDTLDIEVKTFNGEVELGGVVGSDDSRATAARVAGEVRGVGAVRNGLVVRQP